MEENPIISIGLSKNFGICLFWCKYKYEPLILSLCLPFLSIQVEFKKKTPDNKWIEFYNGLRTGY